MRLTLTTIFFLLITGCNTTSSKWQTLDFGIFKLTAPKNWTIVKEQGIDSYYGGLTNGKDSLWFDYGRFSVICFMKNCKLG